MMDAVWLRLGDCPNLLLAFGPSIYFPCKERLGVLVDLVLWLSHSTRPAPLPADRVGSVHSEGGKAMSSDVQGHLVFLLLPHKHPTVAKGLDMPCQAFISTILEVQTATQRNPKDVSPSLHSVVSESQALCG